jgi:hypothetical protein
VLVVDATMLDVLVLDVLVLDVLALNNPVLSHGENRELLHNIRKLVPGNVARFNQTDSCQDCLILDVLGQEISVPILRSTAEVNMLAVAVA